VIDEFDNYQGYDNRLPKTGIGQTLRGIKMSNLIEHAKYELDQAGLFDEDSDYCGDLDDCVMELVKCFSEQEHSGFSAQRTSDLFNRVSRFKPLTPLTDNPDEWLECRDGYWQNKRCPSCFSEDGGKTWYDLDDQKRIMYSSPTPSEE